MSNVIKPVRPFPSVSQLVTNRVFLYNVFRYETKIADTYYCVTHHIDAEFPFCTDHGPMELVGE
jgi:hypothetical protein